MAVAAAAALSRPATTGLLGEHPDLYMQVLHYSGSQLFMKNKTKQAVRPSIGNLNPNFNKIECCSRERDLLRAELFMYQVPRPNVRIVNRKKYSKYSY